MEKSQHLVEDIASAEHPKTMRQLRGFMGLANYYRMFIKGFAKIAAPLNKHLNNTDKNVLSEDACEAFEKQKQELTDMDNILSLPDFDLPFILETDASDECIEAALMQRVEGKTVLSLFTAKPRLVLRRIMTLVKKNYWRLSKRWSISNNSSMGKCLIKTDHHPLLSITTKSKPSVRLGRCLIIETSELVDY